MNTMKHDIESFNSMLNQTEEKKINFPDVQVEFRKGRGTRDPVANILWIMERERASEKHLFLLY